MRQWHFTPRNTPQRPFLPLDGQREGKEGRTRGCLEPGSFMAYDLPLCNCSAYKLSMKMLWLGKVANELVSTYKRAERIE